MANKLCADEARSIRTTMINLIAEDASRPERTVHLHSEPWSQFFFVRLSLADLDGNIGHWLTLSMWVDLLKICLMFLAL